jgi:hypothetical protein
MSTSSDAPAARRIWLGWLGWFAAFLLIGAGWALVTPIGQYPDEASHVYRAVSVVRGEVFPHIGSYYDGTGAITNVPTTFVRLASSVPCRGVRREGHCSFASAPAGSVTVVTGEGRMFPLYYALVGWPSLPFPNRAGWYLMRLVSAVWWAMLLATAAFVVMSMSRRPLVLASAMLVGLSPVVLSLSGAINTSALEVTSALCFWAVVLALIHNNTALDRRILVSFALISAVVLSMCREFGWLWVALAAFLSLASAGRADRRSFLRSRAARALLASVAGAAIVTELWSVAFRSYQFYRLPSAPMGLVAAAHASLGDTPKLLEETTLGTFGFTIPPPAIAEVCWVLAVVAVIMIGFATGARKGLLVAAGVALVVVLPFMIMTYAYMHPALGWWEGRYTLALAIGVPLVGVARSRLDQAEYRVVTWLAWSTIILVLLAQAAVYWNAKAKFALIDAHQHPSGAVLLALGALGLLANIAWADVRWSLASRSPAASRSHSAGPGSDSIHAHGGMDTRDNPAEDRLR